MEQHTSKVGHLSNLLSIKNARMFRFWSVRSIRRATRKHHSAEVKIRVVLERLRGEYSIAELCRREGIAESLYFSWLKEFREAGVLAANQSERIGYEAH